MLHLHEYAGLLKGIKECSVCVHHRDMYIVIWNSGGDQQNLMIVRRQAGGSGPD